MEHGHVPNSFNSHLTQIYFLEAGYHSGYRKKLGKSIVCSTDSVAKPGGLVGRIIGPLGPIVRPKKWTAVPLGLAVQGPIVCPKKGGGSNWALAKDHTFSQFFFEPFPKSATHNVRGQPDQKASIT